MIGPNERRRRIFNIGLSENIELAEIKGKIGGWEGGNGLQAKLYLKGAGSFHIHRKTNKELGALLLQGIWERPNLAHNLVTRRHTVKAEGADPTPLSPPYGQPDRKISLFLRVALESLLKSNFFLHSCTQQGTQTRQNLIFAQDVDENVL